MSSQDKTKYGEVESPVHEAGDIPKEEATPNSGDDSEAENGDAESSALRTSEATSWRVAKSLLTLREQVNRRAPGRSRASDGTIGDAAHQSRSSDHNPWVKDAGIGVVTALDITHDPGNGCDANAITTAIRGSRDARVKYIIWNRRIANSSPIGGRPAWEWRPYTGPNPHTKHMHVSVKSAKPSYDSTAAWTI